MTNQPKTQPESEFERAEAILRAAGLEIMPTPSFYGGRGFVLVGRDGEYDPPEATAYEAAVIEVAQRLMHYAENDAKRHTLSAAQVAEQLGVTKARVLAKRAALSKRGVEVGLRIGREWAFSPAEVEKLRGGAPGNPNWRRGK